MEHLKQIYVAMTWSFYQLLIIGATPEFEFYKQAVQSQLPDMSEYASEQMIETCLSIANQYVELKGKEMEIYTGIERSIDKLFDSVYKDDNFYNVMKQVRDIFKEER